jgi:dienelactone hydrolase
MAVPKDPDWSAYERKAFAYGGIEHDVLRGGDSGPVVLLLHEIPTLSWRTILLADHVRAAGFRIAMPLMLGGIRRKPGNRVTNALALAEAGARILQTCVSWQFTALAQHRTSPITTWLIELARRESAAAGGGQIGVIGMCFSGGFALATAIDPVVGVAVASQPAMPYAWSLLGRIPGQAASVGMDDEHWQRVLDRRAADQVCFRTLRFERDVKSPAARVARIKRELAPDETFDCIPSRDPQAHAVLTDATEIARDPTTEARIREALDSVVATLTDRLGAQGASDP